MKIKNAPLEASNVAVLLEHIPIGQTRSIHSLQVKRVEADHYSIEGGPVVDLVDALAQVGSYSGKAHNPGLPAKQKQRHTMGDVEILLDRATVADEDDNAYDLAFDYLIDAHDMLDEIGAKRKDEIWHYFNRVVSAHMLRLLKEQHLPPSYQSRYADWIPLLEEAVKRNNPTIGQGYALANPKAQRGWASFLAAEKEIQSPKDQAREARTDAMIAKKVAAKLKQEAREAAPARKAPASKPRQTRWSSPEEMVTMTSERMRIEQARASGAYDMKVGDEVMWQGKKWTITSKFGWPALTVELRDAAGNTAGPIAPEDFKWLGPKRSNPHVEERGYFYEVLNSSGKPVALTTSKAEAEDVCANPKQLNLPKGTYSYRHVGGKKLVPTTSAGTRARRV